MFSPLEGYPRRGQQPIARAPLLSAPFPGLSALSEWDRENTPNVAVVNKTLAASYFDDWRRAIGRRFGLATPSIEIVGIVEDARGFSNVKAAPVPSVFVPLSQRPVIPRTLDIRTAVDPALTIAAVRRAVSTAAPGLPIESIETMEARFRKWPRPGAAGRAQAGMRGHTTRTARVARYGRIRHLRRGSPRDWPDRFFGRLVDPQLDSRPLLSQVARYWPPSRSACSVGQLSCEDVVELMSVIPREAR